MKNLYPVFSAILTLFFGSASIAVFAQETLPPTTPKSHIDSWRSWALHTGIGFQKAFFVEIGPAFVYREWNNETLMGGDIVGYGAFEWSPLQKIYGGKIGLDVVTFPIDFGLELKYLTDNKVEAIILTPKAGLSLGFTNLIYGYSFSSDKYPFPSVGKHQVALTFNLNKKFFQ